MKFIKINGLIDDKYSVMGSRHVEGLAFQLKGWEWFRLWVTPGIRAWTTEYDGYRATHWDSGLTVGADDGVRGDTPEEVIRKLRQFLKQKGKDATKLRLKEHGFTV